MPCTNRTYDNGDPCSWKYRAARGYGYVQSVEQCADKATDIAYNIRQVDNHVGPDGHREPAIVTHHASDMRHETKDRVERARQEARDRNKAQALLALATTPTPTSTPTR